MSGITKIHFSKYHALGNDFIAIDNRNGTLSLNRDLVVRMCDRKLGIGANGVLEIRNHAELAYTLVYYNSDGNKNSLCGNGSRCSLAFIRKIGIFTGDDVTSFQAYDGIHHGGYDKKDGQYFISMKDIRVSDITIYDKNNYFVHTGAPHHIRYVRNLPTVDVYNEGRQLRWNQYKHMDGSNINFVEVNKDGEIHVRTYERGVEDETLACGTGATAVAMVTYLYTYDENSDTCIAPLKDKGSDTQQECTIHMGNGRLAVSFLFDGEVFKQVYLKGPVVHVFDGVYFI